MKESFYRTGMLLGEATENILLNSTACVFGAGGVGGHCIDALARCGLGNIHIIDSAIVKASNLNRQICAEKNTVGMKKVEAMRLHIEAVSDCNVSVSDVFASPENIASLIGDNADIVIDCVDTVSAKIAIIEEAQKRGLPVLSSMGAGNRLDPTAVRTGDIYSTSVDPLSRIMRHELRKRKIPALTCVYSLEIPKKPLMPSPDPDMKPNSPASVPFVHAAFGLALAYEAIKLLLQKQNGEIYET